jgi:hypothetical protein
MEKNKYNSLKNYSSIMPAQTLEIIQKLYNSEYLCKCNKPIYKNDEIYTCINCKIKISHLKCLNIKRLNLKNSTKIKIFCDICQEDIPTFEEPYYNCFCGKYYTNQENPNFDPYLIPHGCGITCDFFICEHKNCSLPCHPGGHEECYICKPINKNYKNENINNKQYNNNLDVNEDNYTSDDINSKTNQLTYIINLKGKQKTVGVSCEKDLDIIYCGRQNFMGGWKLKASIWANPFKVSEYENNEAVCIKYEEYIRKNEELLSNLKNLVGKKLACWCIPQPCHCEVLIKLMKERNLI